MDPHKWEFTLCDRMRSIAHNTRQTARHEIRWHENGSSERAGCAMQRSSEGHSADQTAMAQSKCQRALPQQEWIAAISQRFMTAALSTPTSQSLDCTYAGWRWLCSASTSSGTRTRAATAHSDSRWRIDARSDSCDSQNSSERDTDSSDQQHWSVCAVEYSVGYSAIGCGTGTAE